MRNENKDIWKELHIIFVYISCITYTILFRSNHVNITCLRKFFFSESGRSFENGEKNIDLKVKSELNIIISNKD